MSYLPLTSHVARRTCRILITRQPSLTIGDFAVHNVDAESALTQAAGGTTVDGG